MTGAGKGTRGEVQMGPSSDRSWPITAVEAQKMLQRGNSGVPMPEIDPKPT